MKLNKAYMYVLTGKTFNTSYMVQDATCGVCSCHTWLGKMIWWQTCELGVLVMIACAETDPAASSEWCGSHIISLRLYSTRLQFHQN